MTPPTSSTVSDAPDPAAPGAFPPGTPLYGEDGLHGEVEQTVDDLVIARLGDGTRILLRTGALVAEAGTARVNLSRREVEHARAARSSREAGAGGAKQEGAGGGMIIPILEERVRVDTERVETGGVRVVKRVHTEEHEVEQPVSRQQVRVERVASGQPVADPANPPQARQEGETLIIPLLEEVLVVEKRLVVREELRITRDTEQATARQTVPLRKEQAQVERLRPSS